MGLFTLIFIFTVVYVGEVFGVMFGGGGFFIQPALLAAGFEPKSAIATDITAAAFSGWAFLLTTKQRSRAIRQAAFYAAPTVIIGALIGSYSLTLLTDSLVKWIILFVCTLGFLYVATHFKRKENMASPAAAPVKHWKILLPLAGFGVGMYDGFIGAGGGVLVILTLSLIMRDNMKVTINMANWISSLSLSTAGVMFWYKGLLNYELLAVMVPACLLAGFTGAKITETVPEKTLKIIYCGIVSLLLVYLFYSYLFK